MAFPKPRPERTETLAHHPTFSPIQKALAQRGVLSHIEETTHHHEQDGEQRKLKTAKLVIPLEGTRIQDTMHSLNATETLVELLKHAGTPMPSGKLNKAQMQEFIESVKAAHLAAVTEFSENPIPITKAETRKEKEPEQNIGFFKRLFGQRGEQTQAMDRPAMAEPETSTVKEGARTPEGRFVRAMDTWIKTFPADAHATIGITQNDQYIEWKNITDDEGKTTPTAVQHARKVILFTTRQVQEK
ncbi:hypothetical protein HY994_04225 [Candidatus Micrarchaeota archaeon]|nr:hypothetical protein [Candidatus Micrarchaeota archaeon]